MPNRHPAMVVVLVPAGYLLLYLAYFSPVLGRGELLAAGDAKHLTLPHLLAPTTPWSPLLFGGFPVDADPQNLTWYPLAWPFRGRAEWFNGFVLLAYILASSLTHGFVVRLTGSHIAGAIAGCVYGLSGFLTGHLGHTNIIHGAAWAPLLVWSVHELRRNSSVLWMASLAIATAGVILAGHPQIALYGMLLATFYAILLFFHSGSRRWYFVAMSAGGTAIGIGLCGALLLPMLELTGESARTRLTFEEFVGYAFPLRQWPLLFFPSALGGGIDPWSGQPAPYFGRGGGPSEANPFVGLLPLLLAGWGVILFRRRSIVRFWLIVALVTFLLSLGHETPLADITFHVPIYNRLRIPSRHFLEFALAIAVLAGYGVAGLQALDPRTRLRSVLHGVAIVSTVMMAALLFLLAAEQAGQYRKGIVARDFVYPSLLPWKNAAIALPLLSWILLAAICCLWARRGRRGWGAVLVGVVALDVGAGAWWGSWRFDTASVRDFELPSDLIPLRQQLARSGQRMAPLYPYNSPRLAVLNRARPWRLPCALGYAPLILHRFSDVSGAGYHGFQSFHAFGDSDRAFDLLSVRYILVPADRFGGSPGPLLSDALAHLGDVSRWSEVGTVGDVQVYENRRALPRAWLASEAVALNSQQQREAIRSGYLPDGRPFNPACMALVEELGTPLGCDPLAEVRIVAQLDCRVECLVRSAAAGLLVLSDVHYPGWRATVNAEPVQLKRVNYLLRGVELQPGTSRVVFTFESASRVRGMALSIVSLVALLCVLAGGFFLRFTFNRQRRTVVPTAWLSTRGNPVS